MGSLRDDILGAEDLPSEVVETPEWAPAVPQVRVRGLTSAERDAFEQGLMEAGATGVRVKTTFDNPRAALAVRVIVDDDGERVFSDNDVAALGRKSGAALDRIWDKARQLSGMKTPEERQQEDPSRPDASNSTDSP